MDRMLHNDAILRFVKAVAGEAPDQTWIADLLRETLEPAMAQGPWIMDLDSTVVTVYGKQGGSAVGYHPTKPGRPSYSYHTYMIGQLRLPIDVEVLPGNQSHGSHSASALWHLLDHRLPTHAHPWCIREDISYGSESYLTGCEQRQKDYLFKLRKSKGIKALCDETSVPLAAWSDAGHGWEGRKTTVQLSGWSQQRRVIILRKPIRRDTVEQASGQQATLLAVELCPEEDDDDYAVLITSFKHDCENNFADLKNDWSWGGFTTQDQDSNQVHGTVYRFGVYVVEYLCPTVFTRSTS